MDLAQPRTDLRSTATCLFAGVLLVFLAFFGGGGGCLDVREYLDDAQRLWLKGDLRISEHPPVYNRYALGLPLVSGPFVWAGRLLALATGGAIDARGIAALTVPVLGAAAVLLFFFWAVGLGSRARTAWWAALLLAFSSPLVTYTQHFYAEMLVLACVLLAAWSFLRARRSDRDLWPLAAGIAIGLMPFSHNASAPAAAALWIGMAGILLRERSPEGRRWRRVLLLTFAPAVSAAAILGINAGRYGSPFTSGYHVYFASEAHAFILVEYVPRNLAVLARWLVRTPWLAPALVMTVGRCRRDRKLLLPLALAATVQTFFWLCYRDLAITTNRYLLPLTGLYALGLPLLGQWLERRCPARGLAYTMVLFLMTGIAGFMRDDGIRPFYYDTASGDLRCYTWYMRPLTGPVQTGTPCGAVQGLVLAVLLAGGVALLVRAWRAASRVDRCRQEPGTS